MARYVVNPQRATDVLLTRFRSLQGRQDQFKVLQRQFISQLLKTSGTPKLQARMPVRSGKLRRSIRLYLSGDSVRIRALFYVDVNRRARAAIAAFAAQDLPELVRQAASLAAAALPSV